MDSIRLKNYRCFRDEQSARLAPLTLLVGDNGTGKTSFLAMIRALWVAFFDSRFPDFKEEPYDLGSYDEIAHRRGGRGGRADGFEAGFSDRYGQRRENEKFTFDVRFDRSGSAPVPVKTRIADKDAWIESGFASGESLKVRIGTNRGAWESEITPELEDTYMMGERSAIPRQLPIWFYAGGGLGMNPIGNSPESSQEDIGKAQKLDQSRWRPFSRPFASAPVRSKPRRTYDPSRVVSDPEGDYIPMYLADMYFRDKKAWARLKDGLERFGREAGLFDEISVKGLGRSGSVPFQVQVRKFGGGLKGPWRNLTDVGYGVSQALPLMTELLREGGEDGLFLLQQPEVHLHPSAQAALGSLFCRTATRDRQLIVETHSDHLMDRVRMDVRDGVSKLKPSEVSILYFQRNALDVKIHSLEIDGEGNILNAPDDYRRFFMEEVTRSLWRR